MEFSLKAAFIRHVRNLGGVHLLFGGLHHPINENLQNTKPLNIMKNETQRRIFAEAKRLFEAKGYYKTTIREISAAAGVNSGLFNYYFGNKYNLGVRIYDNIFNNIKQFADDRYGHVENPAVFMGIMMRMHTYTLNDERTIKFSADALKEGIFEDSMLEKSKPLVRNIDTYYRISMSDEELQVLLTMTLGVERSLLLQNSLGAIKIDTKTIADNILKVHLFNFGLDPGEIETCLNAVRTHFQGILDDNPDFVCDMIDY